MRARAAYISQGKRVEEEGKQIMVEFDDKHVAGGSWTNSALVLLEVGPKLITCNNDKLLLVLNVARLESTLWNG